MDERNCSPGGSSDANCTESVKDMVGEMMTMITKLSLLCLTRYYQRMNYLWKRSGIVLLTDAKEYYKMIIKS